jgi:putative endonuclease
MKTLDAKALGRAGERRARWFYRLRAYRIVGSNVRMHGGEVDLIVRRGRALVFVEVKTRASTFAGEGFDAVDRTKQQRLMRLAQQYLTRNPQPVGTEVRFDVISILVMNGRLRLTHITDAFRDDG